MKIIVISLGLFLMDLSYFYVCTYGLRFIVRKYKLELSRMRYLLLGDLSLVGIAALNMEIGLFMDNMIPMIMFILAFLVFYVLMRRKVKLRF